jgi:hypothetical protein
MIIESSWKDVASVLDGDQNAGVFGFRAETFGEGRCMYIPYSTTRDMSSALLLCRERGLIAAKLNAMPPTMGGACTTRRCRPAVVQN